MSSSNPFQPPQAPLGSPPTTTYPPAHSFRDFGPLTLTNTLWQAYLLAERELWSWLKPALILAGVVLVTVPLGGDIVPLIAGLIALGVIWGYLRCLRNIVRGFDEEGALWSGFRAPIAKYWGVLVVFGVGSLPYFPTWVMRWLELPDWDSVDLWFNTLVAVAMAPLTGRLWLGGAALVDQQTSPFRALKEGFRLSTGSAFLSL